MSELIELEPDRPQFVSEESADEDGGTPECRFRQVESDALVSRPNLLDAHATHGSSARRLAA
jgi:hypothetical protein